MSAGHRFPTGRGSKNHARASELLKFGRGIRGGAVDIEIRAKLFCEPSVVRPTAYCRDPIAKFLCELNSQMAKPANSLDSDKIAGQRTTVSESIECGNSGAHQRRCFGGIEGFGHAGQRFDRRDHEFLIAPVIANSANLPVRAVHEIAPPARGTSAVLAAVPADTDAFALLPILHTGSDLVDHASHLVPRDTGVRNARK